MSTLPQPHFITQNPHGTPVTKTSYVKFKTHPRNNPACLTHSGNLNDNPFSEEVTQVLLLMRQGEKVEVELNEGSQKESERMVLELVEVGQGEEVRENYEKAESCKVVGNDQIKAKNYEQASKLYEEGLQLVEYDCSPAAQPVKISLLSNLTLSYLNTKRYEDCLRTCDQYLACSLQPNKKIIYRKATANKNLKKWQEAENDIRFGLEVCEKDPQGKKDFVELGELLRKEKKVQQEKEKKVYSRMFG